MSSRVNKVNDENLQDPPIKNPGYANAHSVHRHLEDRQEEVVVAVGVPDATGLQFVFSEVTQIIRSI